MAKAKRPDMKAMAAMAVKSSKTEAPSDPAPEARAAKPAAAPGGNLRTTAISVRADTLKLLNRVASARQDNNGGRKSVSAVIESLVRQHWNELEAEVRAYGSGLGD